LSGHARDAKQYAHDNKRREPGQNAAIRGDTASRDALGATDVAIAPHGSKLSSPSPGDLGVDAPADFHQRARIATAFRVVRLKQVLSDYGKFKRPGRLPAEPHIGRAVAPNAFGRQRTHIAIDLPKLQFLG
jgi:hypothetical protein